MQAHKGLRFYGGWALVWAVLLLGVLAGKVSANAAPPEAGSGGSPDAGKDTKVQMVRERVVLTLSPDGTQATVEGVYVMRNQGETAETLEVRYPLRSLFIQCEGSEIQGLRVWVNDQPVAIRRVEGRPVSSYCDAPSPWAVFQSTFPPGEEVTLRVTYQQGTWGYPPYLVLTYLLETGAGWYGVIEDAEIRVQLPYEATEETIPLSKEFWGYGRGTTPGAHLAGREVTWRFQNLEPAREHNIFLLFLQPNLWQEIQRRRQAVQQNPEDGEAWGFLGLAIKKALFLPGPGYPMRFDDPGARALLQEGLQAYAKAVALKPQDPDWHFGYGQLLAVAAAHTQDPAQRAAWLHQAVQAFRQTLALNPDHEKTLEFYNEMSWLLEGWMAREGGAFVYPGLTATPTFPLPTETPAQPQSTATAILAPAEPAASPTTASATIPPVAPTERATSPVPAAPSSPAAPGSAWMVAGGMGLLLCACLVGLVVVAGGLFLWKRRRS